MPVNKKRTKEEASELKAVRESKVFSCLLAMRSREMDTSKIKKWADFTSAVKDPDTRYLYMRTFDRIKVDLASAYDNEPELYKQAVKVAGTCKK